MSVQHVHRVSVVLVPLLLARVVDAVWRVLDLARLALGLAAGRLPGVMATWSLGMVIATALWLTWEVSVPKVARTNATAPEEGKEPNESGS